MKKAMNETTDAVTTEKPAVAHAPPTPAPEEPEKEAFSEEQVAYLAQLMTAPMIIVTNIDNVEMKLGFAVSMLRERVPTTHLPVEEVDPNEQPVVVSTTIAVEMSDSTKQHALVSWGKAPQAAQEPVVEPKDES